MADSIRLRAALALTLPLLLTVNAVAMLVAGRWWYSAVPGVMATGPFNLHFVADVGVAFLASALAIGLGTRLRSPLLALPGVSFLAGHAAVHLVLGMAHGFPRGAPLAVELGAVYLPAVTAVWMLRSILRLEALRALGRLAPSEVVIRVAEQRLGVTLEYLRVLASTSPATFAKVLQLSAVLDAAASGRAAAGRSHCASINLASIHLAALAATIHDDCGECVQIAVNRALADGVDPRYVRAVLDDRVHELPPPLADAVRFGRGVVASDPAADDVRQRLAAQHGTRMIAELAFAVAAARLHPALKRGLGLAQSCRATRIVMSDA